MENIVDRCLRLEAERDLLKAELDDLKSRLTPVHTQRFVSGSELELFRTSETFLSYLQQVAAKDIGLFLFKENLIGEVFTERQDPEGVRCIWAITILKPKIEEKGDGRTTRKA